MGQLPLYFIQSSTDDHGFQRLSPEEGQAEIAQAALLPGNIYGTSGCMFGTSLKSLDGS